MYYSGSGGHDNMPDPDDDDPRRRDTAWTTAEPAEPDPRQSPQPHPNSGEVLATRETVQRLFGTPNHPELPTLDPTDDPHGLRATARRLFTNPKER